MLIGLLLTPFVLALLILSLPSQRPRQTGSVSLIASLLPLIFLVCVQQALLEGGALRFPWAPQLALEWYFQVDELSLCFLFLTTTLIPLSVGYSFGKVEQQAKLYYALIFLLEGLLLAFFLARNLLLLIIFWEAMLFPLYFLI